VLFGKRGLLTGDGKRLDRETARNVGCEQRRWPATLHISQQVLSSTGGSTHSCNDRAREHDELYRSRLATAHWPLPTPDEARRTIPARKDTSTYTDGTFGELPAMSPLPLHACGYPCLEAIIEPQGKPPCRKRAGVSSSNACCRPSGADRAHVAADISLLGSRMWERTGDTGLALYCSRHVASVLPGQRGGGKSYSAETPAGGVPSRLPWVAN